MRAAIAVAIASLVSVLLPGATPPAAAAADPSRLAIHLARVTGGLTTPVAVAAPNDGSQRLFVVEKAGYIRVWAPGAGLLPTPYLDIRSKVLSSGEEQGLLGLVFHPRFSTNGFFYVYYTDLAGKIQVSRFHVASKDDMTVDPSTEYGIINIPHPTYSNHNGGQLQMLNGGYLYIGTGDGGGAGDPNNNAQNLKSFLGKILRIDVDHTCGTLHYCNPSSNPFYGKSYARYEIWEYGLRNPWRFSFQRGNGSMWIADVGQDAREEIDLLAPGVKGQNMGWDCREGTLNTASLYGGSYCSGKTFVSPIYNYSHMSGRCAIIGGYVYTGTGQASLMGGLYFFADFCTGEIWALNHVGSHWPSTLVAKDGNMVSSFGEGANGELYLTDFGGNLYHLKAYPR